MKPIANVASTLGLGPDDLELYGPFKAKIAPHVLRRPPTHQGGNLRGLRLYRRPLVLVRMTVALGCGSGSAFVAFSSGSSSGSAAGTVDMVSSRN